MKREAPPYHEPQHNAIALLYDYDEPGLYAMYAKNTMHTLHLTSLIQANPKSTPYALTDHSPSTLASSSTSLPF